MADLKEKLSILDTMDEKLKHLDEFNKQLKEFHSQLKELEDWLVKGRQGMDSLLKPEKPMEPQERVTATMELQSDVQLQCETFAERKAFWEANLQPTEGGENTEDAQVRQALQGNNLSFCSC